MHTFADPLEHARRTAPTRLAVVDGDFSCTFAELHERCARLAGAMASLGLARGDRVAILARNSHEYLEAYVGLPAAGYAIVPLNTRHSPTELEYAVRDAGARVLITDRDAGTLGSVVERVVRTGDEYEALLAAATPDRLGEHVTEQSLSGLYYTGGTTGASKGVMLTHRNLIANAQMWMSHVPARRHDVFLIAAPLFHAAGTAPVLANIWSGVPQVMVPAFDPGAALDLIEWHRCTLSIMVPTMLAALTEEQRLRPREASTLRLVVHGGSPIATQLLRRAGETFPGLELGEVYGATELSPIATLLIGEAEWLDHPRARSCGQPARGTRIRIASRDGRTLPQGEVGEVLVRGPQMMPGYWNKPEQTAAALRDGEYWTGDLGYMDDEGYLFLVDRSKDMIISGGENIYSSEVEDVLYRHEAVLEAAVFGVPDDKWGEAVHAVVVPRAGHEHVDPAELIAFCRDRIAHYKVPRGIDLRREPLPKSGPGKVLKRELRAPYWAGRERSVN
ncbi:MAG: long-chain-fatty-acid--CoA ligase [Steroidobacteraceae bacterium]